MSDFYKQIRDNLKNRAEEDFREEDWNDLDHKLSNDDKKINKIWVWAMAFAILTGLLTLNAYLLYTSKFASNNNLVNKLSPDTVFVSNNAIVRDTIVITRIIKNNMYQTIPSSNVSTHTNYIFSDSYYGSVTDRPLWNKVRLISGISYPISSNSDNDNSPPIGVIEMIRTRTPYIESLESNDLEMTDIDIKKKDRSFKNVLYNMRPKELSVSVNSGYEFQLNRNTKDKVGYSFGLRADLAFSDDLSLFVHLDNIFLGYASPTMDPSLGVPN